MYAFSENYILAYSHDEVVHGKRSMLDKMSGDYDRKFDSLRTLYGFQFAHPGKKLTFMGSEFGQFIEWNWQQPLDWLLLEYPKHAAMQRYVRELNRVYTSTPALTRIDKSWDGFQWLNVNDRDRSAVAFMRMAPQQRSYLVCVCNFTPVPVEGFVIGLPEDGVLTPLLSSSEERFGGNGDAPSEPIHSVREPFANLPCSASIHLPAMSAVYYTFKKSSKGRTHK